MGTYDRQRDAEISNGNLINADDLDTEFNAIETAIDSTDSEVTDMQTGVQAFSEIKLAVSADPGSPSNGDMWYNTTSNKLKARINGATVELGVTTGLFSNTSLVSGRRYVWPYTGVVGPYFISTANKLYFFPWIGPSGNYGHIICNLDTANIGNAIMGIYSDSGGKPGSLLKASSTFSLASGTGNKVTALTSAQALSADTLYWLALSVEGTANYLYRADDDNVGPGLTSLLGVDSTFPTNEAKNSYYGYMISHTYTGSLPASPTVTNSDAVGIDELPLIWLEAV